MFPFTLHQLRILKTVALEQSFTKAAASLHISQPSLSSQILRLEKNLETQLINRQTHKIILTKKGQVLLKYSERILALCEESCRIITNCENQTHEEIKVGTNDPFGNYLFPKLLGLGIKSEPQFRLNITVNSTEIIAKQILTNKLDIVIASEEIYDFLAKNNTVKIKYYLTDTLHLILSNTHPFAKHNNIYKADLYNLNYITFESTNIGLNPITTLLLLNQIDIYQFKNVIQLESLESVKTSVRLGLGAAFVPAIAIEKELESQLVKIIEIRKTKITQKLFIINNLKSLDSTVCKTFYDNLLKFRKILLNIE